MITVREATAADAELVVKFIRAHAEFEHMAHIVTVTPEQIRRWLFTEKKAEVLFAEEDGRAVGFALFYNTFSPFLGVPCIYINDLYVDPECRGSGCGKALMAHLARLALQRECLRLEWTCSNWNSNAISFYLAHGAHVLDDRSVYRAEGAALEALAAAARDQT